MGRLAVLAITSAASIILLVVLLVLMEALIVVLGGDVERERGHVSFLAVSPTGIMIIVHRYGVLVVCMCIPVITLVRLVGERLSRKTSTTKVVSSGVVVRLDRFHNSMLIPFLLRRFQHSVIRPRAIVSALLMVTFVFWIAIPHATIPRL
jgi:hypothetical protein